MPARLVCWYVYYAVRAIQSAENKNKKNRREKLCNAAHLLTHVSFQKNKKNCAGENCKRISTEHQS